MPQWGMPLKIERETKSMKALPYRMARKLKAL